MGHLSCKLKAESQTGNGTLVDPDSSLGPPGGQPRWVPPALTAAPDPGQVSRSEAGVEVRAGSLPALRQQLPLPLSPCPECGVEFPRRCIAGDHEPGRRSRGENPAVPS